MPRNVVLCCDGTSNQPADDMTNVVKLYFALDTSDSTQQIAYYHPGLGTMEPPGALTPDEKFATVTLGLATGRGIQDDIRDAYVFLADYYLQGDRVFIFGFSRGAFTARAIAGLLKMYGLIAAGNAALAPYAIRMMFAINHAEKHGDSQTVNQVFELAQRFRETYSRDCKPRFVGVWDTVSSVGWLSHPTHLPYTANNPDVAISRHAIAIDEHRAFFPPNLWRPSPQPPSGPVDLQQVWFPGSHCDVGGGYAEGPESAQSKYPLAWMLREAQAAGLLLDAAKVSEILGKSPGSRYQEASVDFPLHESLKGWWRLAEFMPKPCYDYATRKTTWRPNLFARRVLPPNAWVHESAYLRGPDYLKRLPPGTRRVN
jgi:uncharacterized protein (DUF2235 family)